ncbi:MAG TPA: MOSC domain-containing protein [Blastocatellia bacterium]|nr:MOSC domain-containing protein [Blastocatellia bacterium]
MDEGKLEAIWIKRMKSGPMDAVTEANLVAGHGIEGNANQGGNRQVTLIEQEMWEEIMRGLGASVSPSARRANLMLNGIRLAETSGRVLRVGSCRIKIDGETRPCWQMDEAHMGLKEALKPNWGGGAFGEVLDDGRIEVGDSVSWEQ